MKSIREVGIYVLVSFTIVFCLFQFWGLPNAEKAAYKKGRIAGRAEGQESVKGQLPPPEPGLLLEGVVVGRDVESGKFYLLQRNGINPQKGEYYYVKNDGKIIALQKK